MKKFMIAFAALAMVMSCTTEKLTQDIPAEEPATNGTVVTLTANLPALTKATVDNTAFSWSDGDQISLPSSKGEAIFTTTGDGTFTCTLDKGEVLVSGTAKYPATAPGNTFSSIEDAKKAFMMEAKYNVGDNSITFSHKSAIVNVSFTNVPSFATGLKVTEGENVVATIALSSPSEKVDFYVPITPNGSKKYTFALMENDNVVKSAAKSIELTSGYYYTTPKIAVSVVTVGVIDYIYNGWPAHDSGWKLYYNDGSDHTDLLRSLGKTTTQVIPGKWNNDAQTFHLFYLPVPNNLTKYKVFWTNGTNEDWFGSDNEDNAKRNAFVFEYDNYKDAFYN